MQIEQVEQSILLMAERLGAAATQLQVAMAGIEERHANVCGEVQRIVATTDGASTSRHDASRKDLERNLALAEQRIASLEAQVEANGTAIARRTAIANPVQMYAKSSGEAASGLEAGVLDAALTGLSLEQRIAVKSQLARAGVLS